MRDQKGAGFQGDTRDPEGSWNYQRSEWSGNFRGTHEVKGLVGSHETSRVYDCGCARPEAPFGVTEDTKGRIYRRHSSSRGSGSLRNRRHETAVWEIQGSWGGVSGQLRAQKIKGSDKTPRVAGVTQQWMGCRIRDCEL